MNPLCLTTSLQLGFIWNRSDRFLFSPQQASAQLIPQSTYCQNTHPLNPRNPLVGSLNPAGALQLASPEVKFQLDKAAKAQGGEAAAVAAAGNVDEMKQTSDSMDMGMYQVG